MASLNSRSSVRYAVGLQPFCTQIVSNCPGRPPETGNTLAITYHVHVPHAHWPSLGFTATAAAVAWTVTEVSVCSQIISNQHLCWLNLPILLGLENVLICHITQLFKISKRYDWRWWETHPQKGTFGGGSKPMTINFIGINTHESQQIFWFTMVHCYCSYQGFFVVLTHRSIDVHRFPPFGAVRFVIGLAPSHHPPWRIRDRMPY